MRNKKEFETKTSRRAKLTFFNVSEKYKSNLRFVHLNILDVSKKHMKLKSFVNDKDKNHMFGVSKSRLKPNGKMSWWNVDPKTH